MARGQARARPKVGDVTGEVLDWGPHERPAIPGTPSTPDMSNCRRLAYGLVGLLSTFQAMRVQHHLAYLGDGLRLTHPQTASLLQAYGAANAGVVSDPVLLQAQGVSTFVQQAVQQANILAFNDAFWLLGWAALAMLVVNGLTILHQIRQSRKAAAASPQTAGQAAGAVAL